jgi:hypothetical protein
MKASTIALCVLMASLEAASAQEKPVNPPTASRMNEEQQIISLSKDKCLWMSERKVDSLDSLLHDETVFVHMGGTISKKQELDVIKAANAIGA